MNCYLIPIGGTGERVARAIIHLLAAGAFNDIPGLDSIRLMGIDPDLTSDAKVKLIDLVDNYNQLQRSNVFKVPVKTEADVMWTPMAQQNVTMNNLITAKDGEKKLYEFLYSSRERTLNLSGGYYSHTSIGAYFMGSNLVDGKGDFVSEWKEFFTGIRPTDKIIIICSMFGGTGASGVPTIARELRRHNQAGADTSGSEITGIFLEPYFESNGRNGTVNTSAFATKSKMALEYYRHQAFDTQIFDKMYFLGESGNMMKVAHKEQGGGQKNKANIIEMYAATAVIDALMTDRRTDQKIMLRGTNNGDGFSRNDLNNVRGIKVFDRMAEMLLLSVFYTKFLFHVIDSEDKHKLGAKTVRRNFMRGYDVLVPTNRSDVSVANADAVHLKYYCGKYMEWLREIVTESQGYVVFNESWLNDSKAEDYPYTKGWIARRQYNLYNSLNPDQDERDAINLCKNIDNYKSPTFPGFKGIIGGWEMAPSEAIYDNLFEKSRDRYNSGRRGGIAELFEDILSCFK